MSTPKNSFAISDGKKKCSVQTWLWLQVWVWTKNIHFLSGNVTNMANIFLKHVRLSDLILTNCLTLQCFLSIYIYIAVCNDWWMLQTFIHWSEIKHDSNGEDKKKIRWRKSKWLATALCLGINKSCNLKHMRCLVDILRSGRLRVTSLSDCNRTVLKFTCKQTETTSLCWCAVSHLLKTTLRGRKGSRAPVTQLKHRIYESTLKAFHFSVQGLYQSKKKKPHCVVMFKNIWIFSLKLAHWSWTNQSDWILQDSDAWGQKSV